MISPKSYYSENKMKKKRNNLKIFVKNYEDTRKRLDRHGDVCECCDTILTKNDVVIVHKKEVEYSAIDTKKEKPDVVLVGKRRSELGREWRNIRANSIAYSILIQTEFGELRNG